MPDRAIKCPHCGEWRRGVPVTHRWEYYHEYISVFPDDTPENEEEVLVWDPRKLLARLVELGEEGWEAISLVPHWYWEHKDYEQERGNPLAWGTPSSVWAYPESILGYYVTFKRRGIRIGEWTAQLVREPGNDD
jgi:hypothetical protein